MDTLLEVLAEFSLSADERCPIEIPGIGRDGFATLLGTLNLNRGVELGVEQGEYSEVLCRKNPNLRLFCVDAWTAHRSYRDHVSQRKLDRFYEATVTRLASYNATLIRKSSRHALVDFEDGSLDFVYIDSNHELSHVIHDICEWSKKVRVGGIVSGHDYVLHRSPDRIHVVQAVNAYTSAYEIKLWFVLGRREKVEGEIRDSARSWFWVQPEPRKRQRKIKQ